MRVKKSFVNVILFLQLYNILIRYFFFFLIMFILDVQFRDA